MSSGATDQSLLDVSVAGASGDGIAADTGAKALLERIDTGCSLIVLSWPSARLAAILAESINRRTAHGKNVVILSETLAASERLAEIDSLLQNHAAPFGSRRMVRRDFLNALDGRTDESWFDHLDLVLIPRVEDSLRRPFEWEHLCYRIMDRCTRRDLKEPQLVLVCSPRNHAEGALRRNFPIFELNQGLHQGMHVPHEAALSGVPVKRIWWTFWAAEDDYAVKPLLSPRLDVDYGVEGPLGYYVGLRQVSPSHYQIDPATPTEDQLESLQNRLAEMGEDPWTNVMQGNSEGAFIRTTPFGGEALRDPASNPWRALRALAERGGEALLVNLVLPPTVLRSYQIANAAYFADRPLEPLTPRMQRGVFDAMTQLYLRLAAGSEIDLMEVRRIFLGCTPSVDQAEKDPFLLLRQSFATLFGRPIADRLRLVSRVCWHSAGTKQKKTFRRRTTVSLDGGAQRVDDVAWLDDIDVVDEKNEVVERIRRDHVHQTYVQGQARVLAGKLFRVDAIDAETVRVSKTTSGFAMHRPCLAIALTSQVERKELQSDIVEGPGFQFRRESYQIAFRVRVEGWWSRVNFRGNWLHTEGVNERDYRQGRALRMVLADRQGKPLWSPAQLMALALWINEVSVTLFPESHRFLIAAAYVAEGDRPQTEPASDITPMLSTKPDKSDAGALWIFEDSNADLGLVGACWDRAKWLLELCLDYLNWRLDEAGAPDRPAAPCHLNLDRVGEDFLAYGAEALDPAFDFAGLRDCLAKSGLIDCDRGITEQRRRALSDAVAVSEAGGEQANAGVGDDSSFAGDGSGPHCDFCGKRGACEQGQLLQDGRFRCMACSAVAVDKKEDALKICNEVREAMRAKFSVEFRRSIDVSFVSAETIAGRSGETFVPTGEFDSRAVGLAVSAYATDNGARFMVFVEQGHSLQNTAMTFAHEFTHIWQYERLDYQRMEEEHGKLLIEGHASWAEIAVGRVLAEQAKGRDDKAAWGLALEQREVDLLGRGDEYGVGYRLLLDMGGAEVDGFELLGGMYPKPGAIL